MVSQLFPQDTDNVDQDEGVDGEDDSDGYSEEPLRVTQVHPATKKSPSSNLERKSRSKNTNIKFLLSESSILKVHIIGVKRASKYKKMPLS